MPKVSQPNAGRLSRDVIDEILDSLDLAESVKPEAVLHRDQFSNDFAEVRLRDGTALVVKQGRFDWSRSRFRTSRAASRLIRSRTDLAVPAPLPLPAGVDQPIEAYWRIDLPTLMELWPTLDGPARQEALRSWGRLNGELHSVETRGFGPLTGEGGRCVTLTEYLEHELTERLLPAIIGEWPPAERAVRRLADRVDEAVARVGDRSRLLHGDLHMGNVLCNRRGGPTECVGLIDLETAQAGPPESDLAIMEIHHGELFDHPLDDGWMDAVLEGYDHPIDGWLVHFYRVYHLLNFGFYSALIGHDWHAERVAEAVQGEIRALSRRD